MYIENQRAKIENFHGHFYCSKIKLTSAYISNKAMITCEFLWQQTVPRLQQDVAAGLYITTQSSTSIRENVCNNSKNVKSHVFWIYENWLAVDKVTANIGERAWGAAAPPTRAKPLFFGQKLNFSGRSQQPKLTKKYIFVFIKRKKRNSLRLER